MRVLSWKILSPFFALVLLLGVVVGPATAADFRAGDRLVIAADETVAEDLYLSGATIVVEGRVEGDLTVAGATVDIRGTVTGSVNAAGAELTIGGNVGGAVRAAGGDITISAQVGRDVVVAGGNVVITSGASVGADVAGGVGQLDVAGSVEGDVLAGTGELVIRGSVGGDVDSQVGQLRIESQATIGGDVRYASERDAEIAQGAQVGGTVERRDPEWVGARPLLGENPLTAFLGALLALLLLGWMLMLARPAVVVAPANLLRHRPLPTIGTGLAAWFGQFLLLIVLVALAAAVGQLAAGLGGAFLAPLALLVLAIIAAVLLAQMWVAMAIGGWIATRLSPMSPWLAYALGALVWVLVLTALGYVAAVLGGILFLVAWVLGLGAITLYVIELRSREVRAGQPPPPGAAPAAEA